MRCTNTPMYLWIRQHGSVLNLNATSRLYYRPYGRDLLEEVLLRYVRLYKGVTSDNVASMIRRLVTRYETKYHFLPPNISWFVSNLYPRDKVYAEQEGNQYKLTSKNYDKHQKDLARRQDLLSYAAEVKRAEELKAERDAELAHAVAVAQAKAPKLKIVNRLTKKLVDSYVNIKAQNIPPALADIPGIHDIPIAQPPGVYILMENEKVVYVGQSTNPSVRIGQHMKDKIFDRALLIPTMDLDTVEQFYINKFKPKYNIKMY